MRRGDEKAYNLSEGECSLLAFCYFVAKLEDADSQGKELVFYIDDTESQQDYNKRLTRFFNEDPATEPMVTRITTNFLMKVKLSIEVFGRLIVLKFQRWRTIS